MIGFWFVMQLVSGVGSIMSSTQYGVAYFAHIGGFIAGAVLVRVFGAGTTAGGRAGLSAAGTLKGGSKAHRCGRYGLFYDTILVAGARTPRTRNEFLAGPPLTFRPA